MHHLPATTRGLLMAILMGQAAKHFRAPLTLLVIGGNLGLGLALLYRLSALSKKEPGQSRLRTAFLREPTSSPRMPSGSTTPSSR